MWVWVRGGRGWRGMAATRAHSNLRVRSLAINVGFLPRSSAYTPFPWDLVVAARTCRGAFGLLRLVVSFRTHRALRAMLQSGVKPNVNFVILSWQARLCTGPQLVLTPVIHAGYLH